MTYAIYWGLTGEDYVPARKDVFKVQSGIRREALTSNVFEIKVSPEMGGYLKKSLKNCAVKEYDDGKKDENNIILVIGVNVAIVDEYIANM